MKDMLEMMKYTQDIKLLYVEDNEDTKNSTMLFLDELFENIIVAPNGEDGLNKFKDNEIDLILTDISMPKLCGLEMTKRIREISNNIPIVVISAYNETDYFDNSIKIGADGYIFKPIDMNQFTSVMSRVIQKIKLKDEVK